MASPAEFNGRPVLTILFGGGMILFGLVPIVLAMHMAWSARRWTATPIELTDVELRESETSSETGTVVGEARVRYRYRVAGVLYTGSRIGVHLQAADNLDGWQRRWARDLAAHQGANAAALSAWVDPQRPERAVLDRSLRVSVLLFHAAFVVVPVWPVSLAARALVARRRLRP